MKFKDLLKEKLKEKIPEKYLDKLPSGFQRIGGIIILKLLKELNGYKKKIGKVVLNLFNVDVVCNNFGPVKGKFREPRIEIIAGNNNTITTHIENGCKYRFDVKKIMFSKGNLSEKIRITKQVKKNEIIVDMFAGIGYFTIPIAKLTKAEKIYSIELNPTSFNFLKENIKINHVHNVIAINGDCKKEIEKLVKGSIKANRIIMGYLPPPKKFLPYAFKIIKRGGILHYEGLIVVGNEKKEVEKILSYIRKQANKNNFDVKLLLAKKVKSYGPKIDHYVFDVEVL